MTNGAPGSRGNSVPSSSTRVIDPRDHWQYVSTLVGLVRDRLGTLEGLAVEYPGGVVIDLPRRRLIIVSEDGALAQVLVTNAAAYHKGLGQAEARAFLGDGLLTSEGDCWRAQRRAVAPQLRGRRVKEHLPELEKIAEGATSGWAGEEWCIVRPASRVAQYTLDCLAETLGFLPPQAEPLIQAFNVIQHEAMIDATTQGGLPRSLRPLAKIRLRSALSHLEKAAEAAAGTFDGSQPAWATRDGLVSLFLAGYETTASTLFWSLELLAERPDLQRDLASEVESKGPNDDPEVLPGVHTLFLDTLRLRPPVWLISRRAIVADVVQGIAVRPGDDVLIIPSAVHRLDGARAAESPRLTHEAGEKGPEGRFIPFGDGPRGCPGGALATTEAMLWLSRMVHRYEFRPARHVRRKAHARMSYGLHNKHPLEVRARTFPYS